MVQVWALLCYLASLTGARGTFMKWVDVFMFVIVGAAFAVVSSLQE